MTLGRTALFFRCVCAAAITVVASCTVSSLDLAGKDCPCTADYVCDPTTNRCVTPGALVDAEVSDVASASDAVADGPSPRDSGCPGHPYALFCDDFDDGPLGARWTRGASPIGDASIALSDAQASSRPYAIVMTVPPASTGTASASLGLDLNGVAPPKLRSSFDIYLDELTTRSVVVGTVSQRDGPREYDVMLLAGSAGLSIVEQGDLADGGVFNQAHPFTLPNPRGTWLRMILDIDYGGKTLTLTVRTPPEDDSASPVLDHVAIQPTLTGKSTGLVGGIDFIPSPRASEVKVYVDNVVLEAPP